MPKNKGVMIQDDLQQQKPNDSKFDKQLEDLRIMNEEINKLKTQQRKQRTNFLDFKKFKESHKRGNNPATTKSRGSRARLAQNSSDDSFDSALKIKMPDHEELQRNDSKIDIIQQMLKDKCKQGDRINPAMAFQLLNIAQREEDPEAYEPEFVVQQRKKLELKK